MDKPRPVPPKFLVVELSSCEKASNILPLFSGFIPIPVSFTSKRIFDMLFLIFEAVMFNSICPLSVNLTALLSKFCKICFKRTSSVHISHSICS